MSMGPAKTINPISSGSARRSHEIAARDKPVSPYGVLDLITIPVSDLNHLNMLNEHNGYRERLNSDSDFYEYCFSSINDPIDREILKDVLVWENLEHLADVYDELSSYVDPTIDDDGKLSSIEHYDALYSRFLSYMTKSTFISNADSLAESIVHIILSKHVSEKSVRS